MGGELNSIVKDWAVVTTKVAFVFPDIYDIGISNLGLQILYDLVNQRPDALAERAYAPWVDMEAQMRPAASRSIRWRQNMPWPIFDIIGFSLPLRDPLHQHPQPARPGRDSRPLRRA